MVDVLGNQYNPVRNTLSDGRPARGLAPVQNQGNPMGKMAADDQTLDVDVHCHQCGYNLRGLSEPGRCPECGTPIAESTRSNCWPWRIQAG